MAKRISVAELSELSGIAPGTIRRWARGGFPGAELGTSAKGTPEWTFDAATARSFARKVRAVNDVFPIIGRA